MKRQLVALCMLACALPALAQYPGGGGGGYPGGGGGGRGHRGDDGDPSEGGAALAGRRPERAAKPIPRELFDAQVRAAFAEADLNRDGVVTLDEIRAAHEAKREAQINARFAAVDTNHDGSISREEFMAWQKHLGDPELARDGHPEAPEGGDDRARPPLDGGDRDRREHGARGGAALGFLIAPISANMLVEADANHDGQLSLAEDLAYQGALFDRADTNHDGFLDEDELRAARVARERR